MSVPRIRVDFLKSTLRGLRQQPARMWRTNSIRFIDVFSYERRIYAPEHAHSPAARIMHSSAVHLQHKTLTGQGN
jgi:hypothetical protein